MELREVSPRDGLQDLRRVVPTKIKEQMIRRLADAGLRSIEVTSFVRPDRVPALADADDLCLAIADLDIRRSAFVANAQGSKKAVRHDLHELTTAVAATEAMNQSNFGCATETMLARAADILVDANGSGLEASVTIAVAFGCPFEGRVSTDTVIGLAIRLAEAGFKSITLGDTIGSGAPSQVGALVGELRRVLPAVSIGVHLHDARGAALAGCLAALKSGAQRLESSILGMGACPFAPGASGNIATEDLVDVLAAEGLDGIPRPEDVFAAAREVSAVLDVSPRSAALSAPFYQWRYP